MKSSKEIAEETLKRISGDNSMVADKILADVIDQARKEGEKNYIKSKLLQSEKIRLDGGNMDFFFVLNNDLGELNCEDAEQEQTKI